MGNSEFNTEMTGGMCQSNLGILQSVTTALEEQMQIENSTLSAQQTQVTPH